jgi:hypothetical protein
LSSELGYAMPSGATHAGIIGAVLTGRNEAPQRYMPEKVWANRRMQPQIEAAGE